MVIMNRRNGDSWLIGAAFVVLMFVSVTHGSQHLSNLFFYLTFRLCRVIGFTGFVDVGGAVGEAISALPGSAGIALLPTRERGTSSQEVMAVMTVSSSICTPANWHSVLNCCTMTGVPGFNRL